MKDVGFPISHKENEFRRALVPADLRRLRHPDRCYFEKGFGEPLGIPDSEYIKAGGRVVRRDEALSRDIVCNPKALDADMEKHLHPGQILFGWVHAVQGRAITDLLVGKRMTAVAWENMFEKGGRHVFWRNNEIAGEASVIYAAPFSRRIPYDWTVAMLGRGNCARGAWRILEKWGAKVTIFPKERMFQLRDEVERYDAVVNVLLWDVFDKRLVLSREDVKRMRRGSLIVDVSCDAEGMCLETTHPTTIADPVFELEGVFHFAVENAASIFHRTASPAISVEVARWLDILIEGTPDPSIEKATVIKEGEIVDERIKRFQNR